MHIASQFEHCFVCLDIFQVLIMNIPFGRHKFTFRLCCHHRTHLISKDLLRFTNTEHFSVGTVDGFYGFEVFIAVSGSPLEFWMFHWEVSFPAIVLLSFEA